MKFQLKMGLLTIIQIPFHHVLANEITLKFKYRIGLKKKFNIDCHNTFFCCSSTSFTISQPIWIVATQIDAPLADQYGCNILNFVPNTYRHVPIDYDDYLDVLFYIGSKTQLHMKMMICFIYWA